MRSVENVTVQRQCRKAPKGPTTQHIQQCANQTHWSMRQWSQKKKKPRTRKDVHDCHEFHPPEVWHEPAEEKREDPLAFRIVVDDPGPGYVHVVTPEQVRQRLKSQFHADILQQIDVISLSRLTRKKKQKPCYGMQWGTTLYLYPIEEDYTELFLKKPSPLVMQEAEKYGGRWIQGDRRSYQLEWTEDTAADFVLNNILIHEMAHLLDRKNKSYTDRERYAEHFAQSHGYPKSRAYRNRRQRNQSVRRRHHHS